MNNIGSNKVDRRFAWLVVGLVTLIAICSPWTTAIVYACQGMGGGC